VKAEGGTAIGSWLTRAGELFATAPDRTCHAILLTDGENQHETPEALDAVLAGLEGKFQCDCRGVGTDWRVSELRPIASRLLGSVDIIPQPEQMTDDFRTLMRGVMSKATGNVSLRLWTPQGATVAFVRQVAPSIEDLTDRAAGVNALTADYPTATWGSEARDYHICIDVPPRDAGEEMPAALITLVEGDEVLGQALIRAIWTDDRQLSTRINREVAHYTGQTELADRIQEGSRCASTAIPHRHLPTGTRGPTGRGERQRRDVRLKRDVAIVDEMSLDTRSTSTVRVGSGTT